VTCIKIRSHRRKFSNSDSVEQKIPLFYSKFEKYIYIQRVPKLSLKNITQEFPISILSRNRNQTFFFMRMCGNIVQKMF
jgi:hypothetical protein